MGQWLWQVNMKLQVTQVTPLLLGTISHEDVSIIN